MARLQYLKRHLQPGQVYRRQDLARWSSSVDRHLDELLQERTLLKLSGGLYYYPEQSAFGEVPPKEELVVKKFLNDHRFLLTTPNSYNSLGVGTTQLYNTRIVYNHKRNGEFAFGNRKFVFRTKPHFPKKITPEFLLVDLVDNLHLLAEDREQVLKKVQTKAASMDRKKLKQAVTRYGGVKAKKILLPILQQKAA